MTVARRAVTCAGNRIGVPAGSSATRVRYRRDVCGSLTSVTPASSSDGGHPHPSSTPGSSPRISRRPRTSPPSSSPTSIPTTSTSRDCPACSRPTRRALLTDPETAQIVRGLGYDVLAQDGTTRAIGAVTLRPVGEKRAHQRGHPDHRQCRRRRHRRRRADALSPRGHPRRRSRRGRHRLRPAQCAVAAQSRDDGLPSATRGARAVPIHDGLLNDNGRGSISPRRGPSAAPTPRSSTSPAPAETSDAATAGRGHRNRPSRPTSRPAPASTHRPR